MSALHIPAVEAPPLTSHLRAHLLAQYRTDLRHDERELEQLTRLVAEGRPTKRRTYRIGQLMIRTAVTRADIADLGGRV